MEQSVTTPCYQINIGAVCSWLSFSCAVLCREEAGPLPQSAAPVVTCSSSALQVFDAPLHCFCPCLPNMTGIWALQPYMGANGALSSSCREEAKKRSAGANTPKNSNYFPFPQGSLSVCLFSLVSSPGIPLVLQGDRWCYSCVYLSFVLLPRWTNNGDACQCISFMDSPPREHDR